MYVAVVPNRNSRPAILLRESFREDGKVKNRTLQNLTGSLAWSFAGTEAERAMIYTAHRDVAHAAMLHLESQIGRARIGDGGKDGYEPGHIGWAAVDHYTSRPTLMLAHNDEHGRTITSPYAVQIAGDPELRSHFVMPNAVFCESGRVGSLDMQRLDGLIKEAGGAYQAFLGANLRRTGADVFVDPETGAARLYAIPETARTQFSKKTAGGEEAARAYAAEQGLEWDALRPNAKWGC
jgi:TrwC relaxase